MERPILFRPEFIHPIINGRKTQTRRLVEPQPEYIGNNFYSWQYHKKGGSIVFHDIPNQKNIEQADKPCKPGDILWVRERWAQTNSGIIYGADHPNLTSEEVKEISLDEKGWRSPIHMKKELCRVKIQVTNLWIERLNEISEVAAEKEGVNPEPVRGGNSTYPSFTKAFFRKWNEINPNSEANPFVWVIEFRLYHFRKEGEQNGE